MISEDELQEMEHNISRATSRSFLFLLLVFVSVGFSAILVLWNISFLKYLFIYFVFFGSIMISFVFGVVYNV